MVPISTSKRYADLQLTQIHKTNRFGMKKYYIFHDNVSQPSDR